MSENNLTAIILLSIVVFFIGMGSLLEKRDLPEACTPQNPSHTSTARRG